MKFLFDDDIFSFEALRTAGFANYGALYAAQIDTFAAATALFDHPAGAVSIPPRDPARQDHRVRLQPPALGPCTG
jgi:hypothetical protein